MAEKKTSGQTPLQKALAETAAAVGFVPKRGYNSAQSYEFVRAEDLFAAVRKELSDRGVAIQGTNITLERSEMQASHKSGSAPKHRVILRMSATLALGEEMAVYTALGEGVDSGDKAIAKATTMAAKYLWAEAFQISFGDDPEADETTDRDVAPEKPAKAPSKPRVAAKQEPLVTSDFLARVAQATTQADLDSIRDDLLPHREAAGFNTVRDAVIARRKELEAA